MGLIFPRANFLEFFLNGWTDVTTYMRQTSPVTIVRGGQNEQGKIAPSKLTALMDNTTGDMDWDNPMGAFWEQLGPNTPVRRGIMIGRDVFSRVVSNGWGSSDPGGVSVSSDAWSTIGTPVSDFSVDGSVGKHSLNGTNLFHATYQNGLRFKNGRRQVSFTLPFTDVTGGNLEPANILLRGQDPTTYYMVRCVVTTAEALTMAIYHTSSGSDTLLAGPVTITGITHALGQWVTVAGEIENQAIRGKAWLTSGKEPYAWQVSAVDKLKRIPGTGWSGIRSGVASGNTNTLPIVFSYDNDEVRLTRMSGELVKLAPGFDTSLKIKTSDLEAAGILRRMQQGKEQLDSAPRRYMLSSSHLFAASLVAYWPCDDESLVDQAKPLVGIQPITVVGTTGGTIALDPLAPWLGTGVTTVANDSTALRGRVSMASTTKWQVDWMILGPATAADGEAAPYVITSDTTIWQITVDYATAIINIAYNPLGGAQVSLGNSQVIPALRDRRAHHIRLMAVQNGGNVDLHITVDGISENSAGPGAFTLTPVTEVRLFSREQPCTFGHVAVYSDADDPFERELTAAAYFGHRGETAGRRLERLCKEEGIPFDYLGDLDDTAPMGPQATGRRLDLLYECEDADGGTLSEALSINGLTYVTLAALGPQDADCTLDFSLGHVAPELRRQPDDQTRRNDITVTRKDGGQYRAQQLTGPNNVKDPGTATGAVGRYDQRATLNVYRDEQLTDAAEWLRHLGTDPTTRYPKVRVNLKSQDISDTVARAVLDVSVMDRLIVQNLVSAGIFDDLDLIARGYTEMSKDKFQHEITFNTIPYAPWRVLVVDDTTAVVDSDGTTLAEGINSSATALSWAISDGYLWTTDFSEIGFHVKFGGERAQVIDLDPELITFVNAGTAAHADNANVSPGLPASIAEKDLLLVLAAIRSANAGTPNVPAGYELLWDMVPGPTVAWSNVRLFGKLAAASESAPTVSFFNGAAGDTTSAQMAAFRGKWSSLANLATILPALQWSDNASAQDIARPALHIPAHAPHCLVLHIWWKADDNTGVTGAPGTEIGDLSSILGNDQSVGWSYQIQTTATDIAAGTFTVAGGAAAISRAGSIAIRCDRQAVTVVRSVNDVVKTHAAGTPVSLAEPYYVGKGW